MLSMFQKLHHLTSTAYWCWMPRLSLSPKKTMAALYWTFALMFLFTPTRAYATGFDITVLLDNIFGLISWGVVAIGLIVAVFSAVWLGLSIAQNNPSDRDKCIMGIVGGVIVAASGGLFLLITIMMPDPPSM